MEALTLSLLFVGLTGVLCSDLALHFKVCHGTSDGLTHRGKAHHRYNDYKDRYTNCTYVAGNLEIIFLEGDFDLSFLKDIQEVTGYVLLVSNYMSLIPLTSLRIIRGRSLFPHKDQYFSLFVALNFEKPDNSTIGNGAVSMPVHGLRELSLTSLYEIMAGSVLFFNNNLLCWENTINWDDILTGEGAQVTHSIDSPHGRADCEVCHDNCTVTLPGQEPDKHCWGPGPEKCQKMTRVVCSRQCDGGCFGPLPADCCHPECAGGCLGPLKTQCWACKNFNNGDECVEMCPPLLIYDKDKFARVKNPDAKYAYGTLCVEKCPDHLLADDGGCVRDCGSGRMQGKGSEEGTCVDCDGPCPKTCDGTSEMDSGSFVDANNIASFDGCTIIKGGLKILTNTFTGDVHNNISAMHPKRLSVFETVQEITGYLQVEGRHPDFKSLSFFKNLHTISGRILTTEQVIYILDTGIEFLGLESLKELPNGNIFVHKNNHLCYVQTLSWLHLTASGKQRTTISQNANQSLCEAENKVCDPECSSNGCWGPGNDQCLDCKSYSYGKSCLSSCNERKDVYEAENQVCMDCHEECLNGCTGPNSDNCNECKRVKDGPFCVASCPEGSKYSDPAGICRPCHDNCKGGCTGPLNIVGENGCNDCHLRVMKDDEGDTVEKCLPENSECEIGYHRDHQKLPDAFGMGNMQRSVCRPCHSLCKTCTRPGIYCDSCTYYKQMNLCVSNCSSDHFPDNSEATCVSCHNQCLKCRGPTEADCLECKSYKLYLDTEHTDGDSRFNCTDVCPEWAANMVVVESGEEGQTKKETICMNDERAEKILGQPRKEKIPMILGIAVGGFLFLAVVIALVFLFRRQMARSEENKARLTARISGLEESEPLTPTDAKPDMAMLRLIKESELRRGNIIGSGAFGTVYKGAWIPSGENVKIPVAIKVLQEGTAPNQNKELLEEARIMTSVEHPCCIRILAVCMTAQMMLITQLMPLGCLLDYVRKNKMNIGSKVLLNWCTQIARGMAYLEERGIVHRDLAARNVLVQNATQVKITDFGLAKLLDYNEEEFQAGGGKMPIKWLALECIQHRVFTHKSDVWSFGVTIWELFTFGQRPYESVRARDIPDLLEKGERLPQPTICTIDVYMIMIKCWMLDAESRPSFKELMDEFAKMARDPGRYLVIQGDKLLRLPSHSYDTRDLIRNMSGGMEGVEGPEEIMEADEYLQPQVQIDPRMLNGKVHENSCYDSEQRSDGSQDYSGACAPIREKKYSGLEAAAAAQQKRKEEPTRDSMNSRYSSDPCKVIEARDDEEMPMMPAPPTPLHKKLQQQKLQQKQKMDCQIPVDEDDYLQPKSSKPLANYIDLVNDPTASDYLQSDQFPPPPPPAPNHTPSNYIEMKPQAIDNPEYYESGHNNNQPPHVNIRDKNEKQPLRVRSMSSESEGVSSNQSEPDYYNEFDHLNKSKTKIPSRLMSDPRTESTV